MIFFCFNNSPVYLQKVLEEEDVDKSLWGELESESESESESEEEEEEQDDSGLVTPAEGLVFVVSSQSLDCIILM